MGQKEIIDELRSQKINYAQLARESGVSRATLYRLLNYDGNCTLSSFLATVHTMGYRIRLEKK